ncbi:thioesterase family protein [Actinomadura atramentaria]|uniref:thioesterase family protein n=1 Tax=Actinomadura atramentaria TaxID=1990 RepID=UPI00036CF91F|nr:thioesterase family protein [Actinomadura atramentaria]
MAFYEPLGGGRFRSTPATAGPWSPETQHAGPVAALLGRAFERHEPAPGLRVARITVEIFAPVPVADLSVAVRTVRPGRRVQFLDGELTHDGRTVVRASAWRVAAAPDGLEPLRNAPAPPPLPASATPLTTWPGAHVGGYLSAMEWRFVHGSFDKLGPAAAWGRATVPLVADEQDSPLVRALVVADTGSGIAGEIDLASHLVINTDLTVALHRDPVGEWIFMDGAMHADPGGGGLVETVLGDASGRVGRGLQTMLVDRR